MNYDDFLASKKIAALKNGFEPKELSSHLFGYQRDVVEFSLNAGRSASFLDTGLGKTAVEIEWAKRVHEHTNKPVLFFAPLAVSKQHIREAERFGAELTQAKSQDDIKNGIYITNYEKLKNFDSSKFSAVVLDESSIIKSFGGKTTQALTEFSSGMRFKLAATATPAPNDYMELGQHCAFLDVMASSEMLARWFVTDQREMGKYRLKKHGVKDFWSWVASWARCVGKPSDLGYDDSTHLLPKLNTHLHYVDVDLSIGADDGALFRSVDMSATSVHKEKRLTSGDRAKKAADIVKTEPNEQWMIWVDTDYDADAFLEEFPDAVEVRGNMSPEEKEEKLDGFSTGKIRVLLSKPSIAGMGLNWQQCARTVFMGLSFSYESYYQAVRRFWRFGQKREVEAHIVLASSEQQIWATVQRKQKEHEIMKLEMFDAMKRECVTREVKIPYQGILAPKLPKFLAR